MNMRLHNNNMKYVQLNSLHFDFTKFHRACTLHELDQENPAKCNTSNITTIHGTVEVSLLPSK